MTLLILPFGLIPLYFIVCGVIFLLSRDKLQKKIGSKMRSGITEFPLEISQLLYGTEKISINFSKDGKSLIITAESPCYTNLDIPQNVIDYFKDRIKNLDKVNLNWVDSYLIEEITKNNEAGTHQIRVSIPDEVVLTDEYIEHEIKNVGRVFITNNFNRVRWLLHSLNSNRIERKGDKLFVYIDRMQTVPDFITDTRRVIMSEKQITDNIKNRLWNRVDVRCVSLDEKTYCGEVIFTNK